jgi:HlyD family secretion protein
MSATDHHSPLDSLHRSLSHHARFGLAFSILVVLGLGGWAAVAEIAGAVIAPGQLVVDSNVKKVQHPSGGVVGRLEVRGGDTVKAGDLLIRLDDTVSRANLAIVVKGLDELQARKARLAAERDGRQQLELPEPLAARTGDAEVARVVAGEKRLFELRRTARTGQIAQLQERIGQLRDEIGGAARQAEAKQREIALVRRELDGARELWRKKLMPISKLTALEREATRIEGERAALLSSIASAKGRIAETEQQIFQVDRDFGSEVGKELAEIDAKIGELVERKVAAEDQLQRVDIRAPQDGRVHELSVHTVGGVVAAGETLMLIVPDTDRLTVEAQVPPNEIDQLREGQTARLSFSAFDRRTTEEIEGRLERISPDVVVDPRTGVGHFIARIGIGEGEVAKLKGLKLVPGMPVEAFLETGSRPILSYLMKPLTDQMNRALRAR